MLFLSSMLPKSALISHLWGLPNRDAELHYPSLFFDIDGVPRLQLRATLVAPLGIMIEHTQHAPKDSCPTLDDAMIVLCPQLRHAKRGFSTIVLMIACTVGRSDSTTMLESCQR